MFGYKIPHYFFNKSEVKTKATITCSHISSLLRHSSENRSKIELRLDIPDRYKKTQPFVAHFYVHLYCQLKQGQYYQGRTCMKYKDNIKTNLRSQIAAWKIVALSKVCKGLSKEVGSWQKLLPSLLYWLATLLASSLEEMTLKIYLVTFQSEMAISNFSDNPAC